MTKPRRDLSSIRHTLHMTQKELALRLNLNVETVRRYEQGRSTAPPTYVLALKGLSHESLLPV